MDFLEKVAKLPKTLNDFLGSTSLTVELEKSCFMYGIKSNAIQNISGPVGLIFVKDIKLENLPQIIIENLHIEKNIAFGIAYEINARIFARFPEHFRDAIDLLEKWEKLKTPPIISEEEAWKKVLEIEPWILEAEKEKKEEEKEKREELEKIQNVQKKIIFSEALKKFPDIGEQLITSDRIKIQGFPEPARPSVKNWLSDYTFNAGYEKHNAMERGNYLFKNINAKILRNAEQKKLAYILKAYDENEEITVNVALKQIVFPRFEIAEKKIPSFAGIGNQFSQRQDKIGKPYTKMTFSSPQKFSFEDRKSTVGKYPNYQPPRTINLQEMRMKKEEKKTMPNNLVNLKEE
jgi:hypothetical protein